MLHFVELELNRAVSRGKVDVSVSSLFDLERKFNFILLHFIFVSKVHQLNKQGFRWILLFVYNRLVLSSESSLSKKALKF